MATSLGLRGVVGLNGWEVAWCFVLALWPWLCAYALTKPAWNSSVLPLCCDFQRQWVSSIPADSPLLKAMWPVACMSIQTVDI